MFLRNHFTKLSFVILLSDSIELVIFDCDGVLIDSEVISAQVIVDMLSPQGVLINLDYVYTNFLGRQFSCVKQTVLEDFSINLPDSFESDYRQELIVEFEKNLKTTNGIKGILNDLGVESCVATSSSRMRTERALDLVGLLNFFGDNIFTASEVKYGKPAPDLFLLASNRMQIEPNNCLVIEDSIMGIRAAISAGMNVWHYTGASHFQNKTNGTSDRFSQVRSFDAWGNFFEMVPDLQKSNLTLGDQNDN